MSRPARWQILWLATCLLSATASGQQTAATGTDESGAEEAALPTLPSQVAERNFGYVIGDLLIQRIALPAGATVPDISALTEASRISTWLERQQAVLDTSESGNIELRVRYQIVNSPLNIVHAALPELRLPIGKPDVSDAAKQPQWLVDAWPFTLGPLTANSAATELEGSADTPGDLALRSDHSLPPVDTRTPARYAKIALLMLAGTLLLWTGWFLWRRHRDKVRLPFARARHLLSRCGPENASRQEGRSAWQILHQGFNDTAGQVITTTNLASLYEARPWLQPLEVRIRAFFDASAARHFQLPPRDEPFDITQLARELANRERRNS